MSLRIALCCYTYYPDPVGGTEIYAERLARGLLRRGHRVWILAPGRAHDESRRDGIEIVRYGTDPHPTLERMYGQRDDTVSAWFETWLRAARPDVVHFHAATSGQPVEMVRAASRRCATVVTYHTPTVSCARGTMMLWGRRPCDGQMRVDRCSACLLQSRGMPGWAARLWARALPAGWSARAAALPGPAGFLAGIKHLMRLRHEAAAGRFESAARVVAVCEWARDVLAVNAVPPEKIILCGQGVEPVGAETAPDRSRPEEGLRIGWFGRVSREKAPDVLVRAVRALPAQVKLTCRLHGIVQSRSERLDWDRLRRIAVADPRIILDPPVPAEQVVERMKSFDVIAAPARWMETGPLVVLEALAAGVPVLGADLGGIREKIRHGENGWLAPPEDIGAWSTAIRRLAEQPELVRRAAAATRPPQTAEDVTERMESLYRELAEGRRA